MMKIDEYVIPQDKEGHKNYNNESRFGKMLYKIILWNSNFPMFMCGIISAIPITLLMNLIVTNVFEVSGKHWLAYTVIYTKEMPNGVFKQTTSSEQMNFINPF